MNNKFSKRGLTVWFCEDNSASNMWKKTMRGYLFVRLHLKSDESDWHQSHVHKLPKCWSSPQYQNIQTHSNTCSCRDIAIWGNALALSLSLSRQCCLLGNDDWGALLGRYVWQSGPQTVPPHLHVHEWLLRLPVIFRPGLWLLPPLPPRRRLRVSLI